jgi:hypothetical protein
MKVLFSSDVESYLFDLIETLYYKNYFSFYENAEQYVFALIEDIQQNIAIKTKHLSPPRFRKYGTHYITYHPNKHTTWYIFFKFKGDRFLIGYITNNHISAQHIRGLK